MGLANYFEGDANYTAEQEAEQIRLTQAIRTLIDHNVQLNAPLEVIKQLANQAESIAANMQPYSTVRPLASHNKTFKPHDASWSSPYSPVVGRCNPLAAPMKMIMQEDKTIGFVTFGEAYEGPPNCVHGGIVALTWDHVMAMSNMLANARGPTAWLHVEYRKPTPLHSPLRFEAWIDRLEGKKIFVRGLCYSERSEEVITEATGLFINTFIKNIGINYEQAQQEIQHGRYPPHHTAD